MIGQEGERTGMCGSVASSFGTMMIFFFDFLVPLLSFPVFVFSFFSAEEK